MTIGCGLPKQTGARAGGPGPGKCAKDAARRDARPQSFSFKPFRDEIGNGHRAPAQQSERVLLAESAKCQTEFAEVPQLTRRWFFNRRWRHREQRRQRAMNEFELEILPQLTDFEVTQHVFEKLIEEKTIDPLFVTHCPKELVPLAKQNIGDSSLVDVFELVINGTEIAPGYSELNDPIVQRQRLLEQAGQEKQKIDEEFLLALEHGMPPAGGFGIGIDRVTMLLTGAESIRDVILFPLLRPKKL